MLYLNHAGTSWPKPDAVTAAANAALHASPADAGAILETGQQAVVEFFGLPASDRFLFTGSCTAALATVLADLPWRAGDVVITSSFEHHALLRPLQQLVKGQAIRHLVVPPVWSEGPTGHKLAAPLDLGLLREMLTAEPVRLVACTMASNVTGDLLPVADIVQLAHLHGARCLLDAAQTAGLLPLNAADLGADILVFAGHKAPHGPLGVGGLYVQPSVELEVPAAACSLPLPGSATSTACSSFPGYCDVGSANLPAIAGLTAGLRWLTEQGTDRLLANGLALRNRLWEGLATVPGVERIGCPAGTPTTLAVSVACASMGVDELERRLWQHHQILARSGLHCAPQAHATLGTDRHGGTLRFSLAGTQSTDAVDEVLSALRQELRDAVRSPG